MVNNVIVLAGGAGKRLWPASLGKRPKQFMQVEGKISLFQGTLNRAFNLGVTGSVYVITHEDQVDTVLTECRTFEPNLRARIVIMAEPIARNTAPALALASARMALVGKSAETCLVMAADHLISPIEFFAVSVEAASHEAQGGYIVPYGIVPSHPATGYGYTEAGQPIAPMDALASGSYDNTVKLWSVADGQCLKTFMNLPRNNVAVLNEETHRYTYGSKDAWRGRMCPIWIRLPASTRAGLQWHQIECL